MAERETFVFADRYTALGIDRPDLATCCPGDCEGTGIVPIKDSETAAELGAEWLAAWDASTDPDDRYRFVRCVTCSGTGKRGGRS